MDICDVILTQHAEQRLLFGYLDELADEPKALAAVWDRLARLLEVHAAAEEQYFYPVVLEVGHGAGGADSAEDETKDAIGDHNDIRDAVAEAGTHDVGSDAWWKAVIDARLANSDHMAEEEREDLADVRQHASLERRHEIAVAFLAWEGEHPTGTSWTGQDPDEYVEQHGPDA